MKTLDTLVEDIYKKIGVLSDGKPIKMSDKDLEEFGKDMQKAMKEWGTPRDSDSTLNPSLRMSNIGKPDRQLWYDLNSDRPQENINPSTYIKFLYGHLLEVVVLFFVKLAGHKIEAQQKEVEINGIKGHMDCVIDGEVVDVKTTSGFAFKKFRDGTLAESDNFGYLAQLAAYEEAENTSNGGFLALNKESGELTLFRPGDLDKPNIKHRITSIKKIVKKKNPPDFCYRPIPEGKSGNMRLARECNWCPHKFDCHKDSNDGNGLRIFEYAKGRVYLTHVEKLPNVLEVT